MKREADLSITAFRNGAVALTCCKILSQIEESESLKEVEEYVRRLGEKAFLKSLSSGDSEIDLLM